MVRRRMRLGYEALLIAARDQSIRLTAMGSAVRIRRQLCIRTRWKWIQIIQEARNMRMNLRVIREDLSRTLP